MSVYLCINVVLRSLGLDNVIADNPCTLCTLHTLTLGNEFASGFGAAHHSPAASPQSTAKISTGNRNHQTTDTRHGHWSLCSSVSLRYGQLAQDDIHRSSLTSGDQ